jgi:hypothetical protein
VIQESLFPTTGMQVFVQGETDPKRWPYRFNSVDEAFDLEADVSGLRLLCFGCVEPLAPYAFGPSGRTSVNMSMLRGFMLTHVAEVHPAWVIGG